MWVCTQWNTCLCVFLDYYLQLNRSGGHCSLRGVNTITITASCCGAGAEEAGRGGGGEGEEEDERASQGRQRKGQLWHDSDKLPCIYSNCVMWSFGCVVMCVFSVWPRWWVNTNELVKRRRRGERQTMKSVNAGLTRTIFKQTHVEMQIWSQFINWCFFFQMNFLNINIRWQSYKDFTFTYFLNYIMDIRR